MPAHDRMSDAPQAAAPRTAEPSGWRQISGPLFRKYVTLFLAVVCVALITNGTFEVWFSYREHKASLIRIQSELARGAADKISQFIKEIESQLGWTTQLPGSADTVEQRRFDSLRLLRQVPAITEVALLDAQGREQLRVSRLAVDVVGSKADYSNDPRFTVAVQNQVYYGPVYFRRESEPYMTLSLAGTRRAAGVSVAEVNLKLIWDVIQAIKVGERGRAYVVDAQGRLIAHPDISLVLRNINMTRLAQVRAAREPAEGADPVQEATDVHGHRVLTAHASVPSLNWLVFVEMPLDEAYEPLFDSIKRSGAVLLAGLILALLAGIFLARRMVVPIQAIRRGAARIGAGDLSQRISIKTGDELEALADQFNDMAGRLEEFYADLERKVKLRTQELAQSVAELRALGEVSQAVNSTLDLKTVLDTIVTKAAQLTGTDAGAIYVRDVQLDQFQLRSTYNLSEELISALKERHIGVGDAISAATADRVPRQIADLRNEPAAPITDLILHAGYRALLVVPLIGVDAIVGALVVRRKEPGAFSKQVVDLLQTFGAQSVLAIQNARLHDRVTAQAADLASWNRRLEQRVADQLLEIERMGRLRRFLSPQVAELVLASGNDTILESHRSVITVLFCDMRGFTAFSETAEPEEVMSVLREYHAVLGNLIHKFEGTVERFAGDGIMVLFNAPLPCPDPSVRAVKMAIEMRRQVSALTTKWRKLSHELGFGVGIAHGYATLGRIGFEGRFDYGAFGSAVNLAARLCADAKDGQILIDSKVVATIGETISIEPVGELTLKGFYRPIRAFNVCAAQADIG
jgi:class 3 adenylate cyclase/HAMP domain-containing protein